MESAGYAVGPLPTAPSAATAAAAGTLPPPTDVGLAVGTGTDVAAGAGGIAVAARVLYPFTGWRLSPMVAAAALALSSASVRANSLRLRNGA